MELIDKSALVAEIERRKSPFKKEIEDGVYPTYLCALMDIKDFINTLEVKEVDIEQLNKLLNWWKEVTTEHSMCKAKEVDLGKIIEQTYNDRSVTDTADMDHVTYENIAKHFFELGLKAQQGE